MNFTKFMFLTTIGTIIWNILIISLGRIAGNSWEIIGVTASKYANIIRIVGGIAIGFIIIRKFIKNRVIKFKVTSK